MLKNLNRLIAEYPHRWIKAARDENSLDWFAQQLVEAEFTVDGIIRETTPKEEAAALRRARVVVSGAMAAELEDA